MKLRLDDFAQFVANWESKADNLRRIAEDLRLGLDSFVFFDDNPSERELIRQCLPQVEVVDVPSDPSAYVAALQAGLWFESCDLTDEDTQRTARYVAEKHRRGEQAAVKNVDDYLVSLAMKARLRPVDEPDMRRVVQLLGKTNQFNLTTRRHAASDVRRLLAIPGSMGITLRLEDRFSDHGLVAVILAVPFSPSDRRALRIDTFLMSCRVIGRKVENVLIDALLRRAAEMGYPRVVGEFLPTEKNQVVSDLYQRLGFSGIGASEQGGTFYEVVLPTKCPLTTPVETID
jgi:FkbH-like protein